MTRKLLMVLSLCVSALTFAPVVAQAQWQGAAPRVIVQPANGPAFTLPFFVPPVFAPPVVVAPPVMPAPVVVAPAPQREHSLIGRVVRIARRATRMMLGHRGRDDGGYNNGGYNNAGNNNGGYFGAGNRPGC